MKKEHIKRAKNHKEKMIKCLFYEKGCQKMLTRKSYETHLINEHCEEIFCSVKKFGFVNEEKNRYEKKYKSLLRGVLWADFYQKKAIEKLNKENNLLRKKLKEMGNEENSENFKAFLSNNSETVAGRCEDKSKILKMVGD